MENFTTQLVVISQDDITDLFMEAIMCTKGIKTITQRILHCNQKTSTIQWIALDCTIQWRQYAM